MCPGHGRTQGDKGDCTLPEPRLRELQKYCLCMKYKGFKNIWRRLLQERVSHNQQASANEAGHPRWSCLPACSLAQASRAGAQLGESGHFFPPEKQPSSIPGLGMTRILANAAALPNLSHGDKLQPYPQAVWRGRGKT